MLHIRLSKNRYQLTRPFKSQLTDAGHGSNEFGPCSVNFCAFRHNGHTGFIDVEKNIQAIVKYDKFGDFGDNSASIQIGDKWHLIGEAGELSSTGISAQFLTAPISGAAIVRYSTGSVGFVDANLEKLFGGKRFVEAKPFSSRLAAVKQRDLWGFIDKRRGEFVIAPTFKDVSGFNRGLAAATLDGAKWGYIDKNGRWAIAPRFSDAGDFTEGLAVVSFGKKKTLINTRGEFQAPVIFDEIRDVTNGFASFRLGKFWGVLSKDLLRSRSETVVNLAQ